MEREFRRSYDSLAEIFDFVRDFFLREGIGTSCLFAFCFAAEELFTNLVKYSPGGSGDIGIDLRKDGDKLLLTLVDFDVEEFDVTKVPAPDTEAALKDRKPGGLGLHLVRKLMDDLRYEYRDRQSRITVVKRLG